MSRIYGVVIGASLMLCSLALIALGTTVAAAASFQATGSMTTTRDIDLDTNFGDDAPANVSDFTMTRLNDGTVLLAGGLDGSGNPLSSAEIYNPATGTFSSIGSMTYARYFHTATLLTNGKVLIDGGARTSQGQAVADELYDPSSGTFSLTGTPLNPREAGNAARLNNGMVLVAVGFNSFLPNNEDAELYNPVTGTFSFVTGVLGLRYFAASTTLKNGQVLIAGGNDIFDCNGGSLATAILYDPPSNSFINLPNMTADRDQTTATLLKNGKVLIAGGTSYQLPRACSGNINPTYHGSAELFDPVSQTFTATGAMTEARAAHTATLLPNGFVLMAGGYNTGLSPCTISCPPGANAINYTEYYNPTTGKFVHTASMLEGRSGPAATLLNSGQVLVAGGLAYGGTPLSSAELFTH